VNEKKFMQRAIALSLKGSPSPRPFVGCVIVKGNKIIAEGYFTEKGNAHAEINALNKAGKKAKNAIMYVSLEPCSHYGRTPPCTKAIIKAGIKKVVVALKDPNPVVNGKGIKELRKAGIQVELGLMEAQAKKINEFYIKFKKTRKPFVVLKAAISLDGKIATKEFDSKWISSKESRKKVHELRSKVDAVLVGENTVIKDNPKLTSRIKNGRNPLRIIVATKKISSKYDVFNDSNFLIATTNKHLFKAKKFKGKVIELKKRTKKKNKRKKGNLIELKETKDSVDLKKLMKFLGKKGISSLMVEGGSKIFTSFLKEKLADKLMLFISPKILGNDSIPLIGKLEIKKASKAIQLKNLSFKKTGKDLLIEAYL
jgi:diaminohydroxyphosphoribosylaminopyrimidine deaminase/5-amino-6-(5-phosphoribosylamino)uracil reductase